MSRILSLRRPGVKRKFRESGNFFQLLSAHRLISLRSNSRILGKRTAKIPILGSFRHAGWSDLRWLAAAKAAEFVEEEITKAPATVTSELEQR